MNSKGSEPLLKVNRSLIQLKKSDILAKEAINIYGSKKHNENLVSHIEEVLKTYSISSIHTNNRNLRQVISSLDRD